VEQLQQFGFVQGYVLASFAAFLVFGLAFFIGARRGVRAGVRWLLAARSAYIAAIVGLTVWGVLSGQWASFMRALGFSVLLEIAVFVVIWLGIMYFMASRYLSSKYQQEKAQVGTDA